MSARWKRDSDAKGASGARTSQTYILGIGASGALLAGAGVALISLVGLVSFDVWPGSPPGVVPEEAQLNFGPGASTEPDGGTPLGEADDLIASVSPLDTAGRPPTDGAGAEGPNRQPASDQDRPEPQPPAPAAPTIPLVPPPVEPDSRADDPDSGTGRDSTKDLPKGGRPRPEPSDDPEESDPVRVPEKVFPPARPILPKGPPPRGGRDDDRRGSSGSNSSGRRGRPMAPPSESTESTPATTSPSSSSSGSRLRRGRGGR